MHLPTLPTQRRRSSAWLLGILIASVAGLGACKESSGGGSGGSAGGASTGSTSTMTSSTTTGLGGTSTTSTTSSTTTTGAGGTSTTASTSTTSSATGGAGGTSTTSTSSGNGGAVSVGTAWSRRAGDAATQRGERVLVDAAGNVIVVGQFWGAIDLGGGALASAGNRDAFVAKYDVSGNHLWSKRFGDASSQLARDGAIDAAGNIVITGLSSGTIDLGGGPIVSGTGQDELFVAKLDPSGNHVWSKHFAVGFSVPELAMDPSGNLFVAGAYTDTINLGGADLTTPDPLAVKAFLLKLDSGGNHVWSQAYGDRDAIISDVVTDTTGNVLFIGTYSGDFDTGSAVLQSANRNTFVAKANPSGVPLWIKGFGTTSSTLGHLAVDAGSNVVITGQFRDTINFGGADIQAVGLPAPPPPAPVPQAFDVYVAKLSASGAHIWSKGLIGTGLVAPDALALDGAGNIFLVGAMGGGSVDFGVGPVNGNSSPLLATFSASGAVSSVRQFGTGAYASARSVAVDATGYVALTGVFDNLPLDFGNGPLLNAGGDDFFVARLAP